MGRRRGNEFHAPHVHVALEPLSGTRAMQWAIIGILRGVLRHSVRWANGGCHGRTWSGSHGRMP